MHIKLSSNLLKKRMILNLSLCLGLTLGESQVQGAGEVVLGNIASSIGKVFA